MSINASQLQLLLGRQLVSKIANKGARENVDFPTTESISFDNVEPADNGTFTADVVLHRIENFHMTVQLTDEIKEEIGGYVASGKDAEKAQGQVVVVCDVDTNDDAVKWHLVIAPVDDQTVAIQSSEFIGNPRNITVTNKSCSYGGVNYREFDKYWNIVRQLWEDTAAKTIKATYSSALASANETFNVDADALGLIASPVDKAAAQKLVQAYDGLKAMIDEYQKHVDALKGADLLFNNADEYESSKKQAAGAKVLIADQFAPKMLDKACELSITAKNLMMAHSSMIASHAISADLSQVIVGLRISVVENFRAIAGKYSSIVSKNFNERTYGQGTGMKRFAVNAKSNDELCDDVNKNLRNILSSVNAAQEAVAAVTKM